jgi:hypothetical protein
MYILLYSIIVSLVLFGIIHYIENNTDDNDENGESIKYDMYNDFFNLNNLIKFVIIFSFIISLFYFAFDDTIDVLSMIGITDNDYSKLNNINKTNIVDPSMLRNTSEPMSSGFEPYNSGGSDVSSMSDSTSVTDSDV